MIRLRHKLWIGFGSLVLIILAVSVLSVVVLTHYRHALERVFRDNYDSAVYCDAMKNALDQLNLRNQRLIWRDASGSEIDMAQQQRKFEENLAAQTRNTLLPGESEKTAQLAAVWKSYKADYAKAESAGPRLSDLYRRDLFPRHQEMKRLSQDISDMNIASMASVDGKVGRTLIAVRDASLVLVVVGMLLAGTVVWTAGAAILHPLLALTRSVQEIEAGNLDLRLPVKSNDEIGQLAQAFNSMAAHLREYRQLGQNRLLRTERTTQLAIDSLPDAVFIIDPQGRVEISNRTARTHFGIEPGSIASELRLKWLMPLYESILRDRKPIDPQGYKSAIQLFEDGQERFLLPRAVPMLGETDDLIGVAVILVDLTRLRHADEAKSSMISTVSHELRTPLTGVRMSLSLLAGDKLGATTPKQQKLIWAAREDSDRLYRIIENLLNISRMEAGRAQFNFRPMNPSEIVSSTVEPLRPGFSEKGVSLEVLIEDNLPGVTADPIAIGSALSNLVSNALKFTPAGQSVRVSAAMTAAGVEFKVTDTGPGIPEEYRKRIFEKFFRIPQKSGPTGAGLGLTIASEILEAHGASLQLASTPSPGGATFYFRLLPLKPARQAQS